MSIVRIATIDVDTYDVTVDIGRGERTIRFVLDKDANSAQYDASLDEFIVVSHHFPKNVTTILLAMRKANLGFVHSLRLS